MNRPSHRGVGAEDDAHREVRWGPELGGGVGVHPGHDRVVLGGSEPGPRRRGWRRVAIYPDHRAAPPPSRCSRRHSRCRRWASTWGCRRRTRARLDPRCSWPSGWAMRSWRTQSIGGPPCTECGRRTAGSRRRRGGRRRPSASVSGAIPVLHAGDGGHPLARDKREGDCDAISASARCHPGWLGTSLGGAPVGRFVVLDGRRPTHSRRPSAVVPVLEITRGCCGVRRALPPRCPAHPPGSARSATAGAGG